MSIIIAYLLGILTVLIIIVPMWYMSKQDANIGSIVHDIFCTNVKLS